MIFSVCLFNDIIVFIRFIRSRIWGYYVLVKEKIKDFDKGC